MSLNIRSTALFVCRRSDGRLWLFATRIALYRTTVLTSRLEARRESCRRNLAARRDFGDFKMSQRKCCQRLPAEAACRPLQLCCYRASSTCVFRCQVLFVSAAAMLSMHTFGDLCQEEVTC